MERAPIHDGLIAHRGIRIKLEITSWEALHDVAQRKGCSVHALLAEIDRQRKKQNLNSAIRNYVVEYYRELAERSVDGAGYRMADRDSLP